ncbi:MAG: ImmA/IrrE family metallo-endopeptidase [Alphaproteobacteria bacterium]|jgi:hypothetical protein|nr:ImmA/IrrE family metallo-endopeptidase [Alphaproteobacteria bacterium]
MIPSHNSIEKRVNPTELWDLVNDEYITVYRQLCFDKEVPFPIRVYAKRLGLEMEEKPLRFTQASQLNLETKAQTITINELHQEYRKRYSIAIEVARFLLINSKKNTSNYSYQPIHYVSNKIIKSLNTKGDNTSLIIEENINYLAILILISKEQFIKKITEYKNDKKIDKLDDYHAALLTIELANEDNFYCPRHIIVEMLKYLGYIGQDTWLNFYDIDKKAIPLIKEGPINEDLIKERLNDIEEVLLDVKKKADNLPLLKDTLFKNLKDKQEDLSTHMSSIKTSLSLTENMMNTIKEQVESVENTRNQIFSIMAMFFGIFVFINIDLELTKNLFQSLIKCISPAYFFLTITTLLLFLYLFIFAVIAYCINVIVKKKDEKEKVSWFKKPIWWVVIGFIVLIITMCTLPYIFAEANTPPNCPIEETESSKK